MTAPVLQTHGWVMLVYTSPVCSSAGRLVDVARRVVDGRRGFRGSDFGDQPPVGPRSDDLVTCSSFTTWRIALAKCLMDQPPGIAAGRGVADPGQDEGPFDQVRPTLRPTAKLAEAIEYVLNRWDPSSVTPATEGFR